MADVSSQTGKELNGLRLFACFTALKQSLQRQSLVSTVPPKPLMESCPSNSSEQETRERCLQSSEYPSKPSSSAVTCHSISAFVVSHLLLSAFVLQAQLYMKTFIVSNTQDLTK